MAIDHRGWDEDILRDLFNERDQHCIRNIQLGDSTEHDIVYWSKESYSNYSVRSAYRMLQHQKNLWRQEDNESLWRKIWKIKAPHKILNFVWRSLSGCLSTLVMLQQKNVPVESVCPVCRRKDESITHILVKCPLANLCWQIIVTGFSLSADENLFQWWGRILSVYDKDKQAEIATISWSVWRARNELGWNKKYTQLNFMIANAKQYLVQWKYAQSSSLKASSPNLVEGDGAIVWAEPQKSKIKVSVDATIFGEKNSYGMGMVARDDRGKMIQAKTVCKVVSITPEHAEAMAIKEALSWVKDKGWQNVVLESDCLVAVQAIRSKATMSSPFGRTVEDCRDMIRKYNTIEVFFVKRSANMAAHELARGSYSYPDRVFDRSSVPIEVHFALEVDSGN